MNIYGSDIAQSKITVKGGTPAAFILVIHFLKEKALEMVEV